MEEARVARVLVGLGEQPAPRELDERVANRCGRHPAHVHRVSGVATEGQVPVDRRHVGGVGELPPEPGPAGGGQPGDAGAMEELAAGHIGPGRVGVSHRDPRYESDLTARWRRIDERRA